MTDFRSNVSIVSAHAQSDPARVAMRQKDFGIWQEITWSGFEEIMHAVAAGLMELGMQDGEHIGILSENRREWVLAQFGINAAGGVVTGMYPTSPAPEIEHLAGSSDTTMLFIEDQEQLDKIIELRGKLPKLRQLIIFNPKGTDGEAELNLKTFDEVIAMGRAALEAGADTDVQARKSAISPEHTAMMVFTSGSTGLPKAAEISHHNLSVAAALSRDIFGEYPEGTNVLSYLPLCHIAEQNVTVTNALASKMVMNFGESLRTIIIDLREVAPQIFFGVPRIWEKMRSDLTIQAATAGTIKGPVTLYALKRAERRGAIRRDEWSTSDKIANAFWDWTVYRHIRSYLGLGRVKFAISAAAPISEDLLGFMRGIGINIREAWGMSETTGAATIQPDWGCSEGRVGHFVDSVEYKITDDGELLVKGGIVFKGYYNRPDATAETIVDGWLHTGDVAEACADGSISLIDRKKDIMINAAGKNLSPSLIENIMKASPFIKECIVVADKRPFVTALVQIDMDPVRLWAESKGIAYTTFRSLAENPQVIELIDKEIARQNGNLARVEQIKKVHLLSKELDHDDGEVTATMKVRRNKVFELYDAQIERLYA
ncbi:long-chain fatty acid--CoA ligase [Planktotalea sp.]|uniref:AMP-dependent synthetase/ligase n=1 Tax=Planktotalea sp. TaxID=2029877 RepID=UPI0025FFF3B3|nr:long-chain fatty acid--CoA ligase [Planktotalea sp.]